MPPGVGYPEGIEDIASLLGGQTPQGLEPQQGPQPPQIAGQTQTAPPVQNPVAKALKDLQVFIAAQQENGSPRAGRMMESLKNLIGSFSTDQAPGPQPTGRPSIAPAAQVQPSQNIQQPNVRRAAKQLPEHAVEGAVPAL